MVGSCVSMVSWYGSYLGRTLSAAGLSSQTMDVDDEYQTTIHFWGPAPTHGHNQNQKPSLILIHGFGPHGVWQWRQQVAFFARHFRLYIPDLVFFGESTSRSSQRTEVFQAVCLGKFLLHKLGVQRFSLVGTSYGGFVAYHMASMWPDRVQKVVIASSAVNMRLRDNAELLKRAKVHRIEDIMLPATAPQLRKLIGLAVFRRPYLPDFLLNDFIDKLYSENKKEKLELLKGLTLGHDDTVNISPLQQEVLIVWGDHDQIFLLEKAAELKGILGEKARLEVIKNTSHLPQIEQAGQFNNIVYNFLCGSS